MRDRRGEGSLPSKPAERATAGRSFSARGGVDILPLLEQSGRLIHDANDYTASTGRPRRRRRMAAVPFFIQSPDAGRYCLPDPHQLDSQTQLLQQRRATAAKSEPIVDDELPPLLELRDSAARRTLDHVDMLATDRDPVGPPVDVQHLPSLYRSSTGAAMDARTSTYPGHDDYYRNMSDFTGYQYPSSLIARPFGNGYCRSAYADKCARRYPIEADSYFHPGSVQPAWARLPVGGAFPFPIPQDFTAANGGRHEYQTPVATTEDCCRTELVAERSFAAAANHGCGQTSVNGGSSGSHRRRPTVSDRSPPLRTTAIAATSNSCCRLDSTDGGTERDRLVPTTSDDITTIATSKSTTSSTTTSTTPVVVYPWMRKLHSRANSSTGKSVT